jgi:predicted trehalose synthase
MGKAQRGQAFLIVPTFQRVCYETDYETAKRIDWLQSTQLAN